MSAHKTPETGTNALHRLLLKAVPDDAKGMKSISHLSKLMGISRSAIWKWIKKCTLPPKRAKEVVDLSEGRVTLAEFDTFVYNL